MSTFSGCFVIGKYTNDMGDTEYLLHIATLNKRQRIVEVEHFGRPIGNAEELNLARWARTTKKLKKAPPLHISGDLVLVGNPGHQYYRFMVSEIKDLSNKVLASKATPSVV